MRKTLLPLALTLALSALSAHADEIFTVTVNTQSLAGTTGYVDFQFNPGELATQSATVDIKNFAGATYLASSQTDVGGASGGPLPATVVLTNSTVYNDDNEGVRFGNTMTFTLDFTGGAVNAPNNSPSGSSFAFSLFDSTDTNPLLTNDPNGFAAVVNISGSGIVTTSTPSSAVIVSPEPASWLTMCSSLGLFIGAYLRRRR
jgi:hypothetical protein